METRRTVFNHEDAFAGAPRRSGGRRETSLPQGGNSMQFFWPQYHHKNQPVIPFERDKCTEVIKWRSLFRMEGSAIKIF